MATKPITPNAALVSLLRPPAGAKSAGKRAFMLLKSLEAIYGIAVGEGDFGAAVFEPLWSGPFADMGDADLEAMLDEIAQPDPPVSAEHVNAIAVFVGAAYAVRALRADKAGDQLAAWRAVADAAAWNAFVEGRVFVESRISINEAVERARSRREWTVNPPERERDPVAPELYRFLVQRHAEGAPRPTAAEVLLAWAANPPKTFLSVTTLAGVRFKTRNGDVRIADHRDVMNRIRRMAPLDIRQTPNASGRRR